MLLNIFNKYCQALCPESTLDWTGVFTARRSDHDPRGAGTHLRTRYRIAVVVVLHEPESLAEPHNRLGKIRVNDVRQYGIDRHRTVAQHGITILRSQRIINGSSGRKDQGCG